MSIFETFLESWGLSSLPDEPSSMIQYRSIIEYVADSGNDDDREVVLPKLTSSQLSSSVKLLKSLSLDDEQANLSVTTLTKLIATLLFNIRSSNDFKDSFIGCELILIICSLPGANAYGLINSNLLNSIVLIINRAIHLELNSKPQTNFISGRKIATKVKASIVVVKGFRTSKRLEKENAYHKDEEKEIEEEVIEEQDEDNFIPSQEENEEDKETTREHRKNHVERCSPATLLSLLHSVNKSIDIFLSRKEESVIEPFVDAMTGCLYLTTLRSEFADSTKILEILFTTISSTSFTIFVSVVRSLLPALTYTGRDNRLPEGGKLRNQCHSTSIRILIHLISHFSTITSFSFSWYDGSTNESIIDDQNKSDDLSTDLTRNDNTSGNNISDLGCFYKSIVGIMERMTIISPDRAPVRNSILLSILKLISHISNLPLSNVLSKKSESKEFEVPKSVTKHYLSFLCKLCKSTKISYRSFGVEIISSLLIPSSVTESLDVILWNDDIYEMNKLLYILIRRCNDIAPTVRLRGLSSIHDIIVSLSKDSPMKLSSTILEYVLGCYITFDDMIQSSSTNVHANTNEDHRNRLSLVTNENHSSTHNTNYINLLEILRLRTLDNKPIVRAKAIQAYSLALSISWPRISMTSLKPIMSQSSMMDSPIAINTSMINDEVTMLLTEEDIDIFVKACNDASSITIRKQGLVGLTQLLQSRPSDVLLQEAWIGSVLPLVADPESTITQKLVSIIHELFIEPLITWSKVMTSKKDREYSRGSEDERSISLLWHLCNRIAISHRENLLRSSLLLMIKQGILVTSGMKSLYKAIWIACSYHDRSIENILDRDHSILGLRQEEPDMICKTGWILLEALINHPIPNTENTTTTTYLHDINFSDTIVNYYKSKVHSINPAVVLDTIMDDDVIRILKILEQLVFSLQSSHIEFLEIEMDRILFSFQYNYPMLLSIAISLRYALSILSKNDGDNSSSSRDNNGHDDTMKGYDRVMQWCKPLLDRIYLILHSIVWNIKPYNMKKLVEENYSSKSSDHISYPTSMITTVGWLSSVFNYGNSMDVNEHSQSNQNDTDTYRSNPKNVTLSTIALYLLGDIILLGFASDEDENSYIKPTSTIHSKHSSDIGYMISKISSKRMKINISDRFFQLIQLTMGHHYPISTSGEIMEQSISKEIRAFAFVTMGKLCLRSQKLARENINIYLREIQYNRSFLSGQILEDNSNEENDPNVSFMVRNNALLILSDFCIRYTNLIERHIETIATCLQDPSIVIRRHTLILLSSLILQDYIKFKTQILFRFLCCLLDDNQEFNELAKVIIQKIIQAKSPEFLSMKFSEAIVLFNECYDHPVLEASSHAKTQLVMAEGILSQPSQSSTGPSSSSNTDDSLGLDTQLSYSLHGGQNSPKRMRIYSFMMEGLNEEQRIQVTAKIVQDILGSAAERGSSIPLSMNENQVLQDTLQILQSPMLKITRKISDKDIDCDIDTEEVHSQESSSDGPISNNTAVGKEAAITKAKIKVLKVLSKQHMINHILPVSMSLKHVLEAQRSPIQGVLMEYLLYLISQHKVEVSEALNTDPILKLELEYDLKNYEKNKEKERIIKEQAELAQSHEFTGNFSGRKGLRVSMGGSIVKNSMQTSRQSMSVSKDSYPSIKKSVESERRLSIRSKSVEDDEEEDDIANRLTSSVMIDDDSHLNRLKTKRWSISLPASFGNDPDIKENEESNIVPITIPFETEASNQTVVEVDSLVHLQSRKSKRSKDIMKQESDNGSNFETNVAVEVVVSHKIINPLVSPEKKRVNTQPTPDLTATKTSKSRSSKTKV